ncbi:MAG: hypothetical protein ACOYON_14290 [Fimbriimonas sp.]
MNLNSFAAARRLALFDRLKQGLAPEEGTYSAELFAEARVKGAPQMGSTRYEPNVIHFEFIYPDARSSATIFTVSVPSPERIVHLPVPGWVVESIWQGEIFGSFLFESEAKGRVEQFLAELEPEANVRHFAPKAATRRE